MKRFDIGEAGYQYIHYNPNPKAKYGLGLTWWYSNQEELLFFLEYINETWLNRDMIDISVCSYALLDHYNFVKAQPLCNYIVYCEKDWGKQGGTMAHLNGALYPPYQNPTVKTVTHTDCDEVILNAQYFFGLANILLDSEKALLGAQITWCYDMFSLKEIPWNEEQRNSENWHEMLHAFIIINKGRVPYGSYFPIKLGNYFHTDLWSHFISSGFTRDDAYIIKRRVFDYDVPNNFLYSFNFNMGILHGTNDSEYPEDEDRKIRLIKLMMAEKWDGMSEGFKWHFNPDSPRPNYAHSNGPPYTNYFPILPAPRENPKK